MQCIATQNAKILALTFYKAALNFGARRNNSSNDSNNKNKDVGNSNKADSSSSEHLGASPALVAESLASARRILSGAYSRQTLVDRSSGLQYSAHEFHLAPSCCIYGCQKWHSFTTVCTGGVGIVELLAKEFQPPGSGQAVQLSPGQSVNIPAGRPYYLRGQGFGQARLLIVSVPPLLDDELQDADGSFPRPPTPHWQQPPPPANN